MTRHVVAPVGAIPRGGRLVVEVAGRKVVVFNLDGAFFALLDRCPHQGGSLGAGLVTGEVTSTAPGEYAYDRRGEVVRCPWHAWAFDIRTGRSRFDPRRMKVRCFPAEVAPGAALVAERFPVRVEDDYVVIEA